MLDFFFWGATAPPPRFRRPCLGVEFSLSYFLQFYLCRYILLTCEFMYMYLCTRTYSRFPIQEFVIQSCALLSPIMICVQFNCTPYTCIFFIIVQRFLTHVIYLKMFTAGSCDFLSPPAYVTFYLCHNVLYCVIVFNVMLYTLILYCGILPSSAFDFHRRYRLWMYRSIIVMCTSTHTGLFSFCHTLWSISCCLAMRSSLFGSWRFYAKIP